MTLMPAVSRASILMVVLATATHAQETVTVRVDTPLTGAAGGAADTRYTGFLHSLTPTLPGTDYFEALKPAAFRTGVLTNLSGGGLVGDFQTYHRVRKAGATFEYIVSDAVYVKPIDQIEWPSGPKDPTYAKWEALLDSKIAAAKAAGGGAYVGRIDMWNEPDYDTYWPDQGAAGAQRFFEAWKRGHAKVRAQLPGVPIVGPSLSL